MQFKVKLTFNTIFLSLFLTALSLSLSSQTSRALFVGIHFARRQESTALALAA
jgi:hypothetical protein